MSTRMIFKERYAICLEEIKKQGLKINNTPSIWKSSNDFEGVGFVEFVKEADDILHKVSSICFDFGLDLYIDFSIVLNEDWSIGSLKDSVNTMYDYEDEEDSKLIVEEFRSFMDSVYRTIEIPIVLLIFSCVRIFCVKEDSNHIRLSTIHISRY